jgi:hypothetical protein
MRKLIIILLISVVVFTTISTITVSAEDEYTEEHQIVITTEDIAISVEEEITIIGDSNDTYTTITFWVQSGAEDVSILVNTNPVTPTVEDNEYICDISLLNIVQNSSMDVSISYKLSKNDIMFQKDILRNTEKISVKFDGIDIYSAIDINANSHFTIQLYIPTETPLSIYVIVIILLLVTLVIVLAIFSFRKQKIKAVDLGIESEELLKTKKTLLMTVLKDIEKQHRAKQISDDTYHKLKEQYKQQAVDAMKKIEDSKSKVK